MEKVILKNDFEILETETGRYMLYTPYKKYFIPELFYRIIELLQKGYPIEKIESEFEGSITHKEIEEIVQESFCRMGIVRGSDYDKVKSKKMLIWRKDIVAPAYLYNRQFIALLYKKGFVAFLWICYFGIYGFGLYKFEGKEIFYNNFFSLAKGGVVGVYLLIFYFSNFVHELGHYLTSIWLGADPGKIGIGVYIVMPVLYVSLDDVWKLSVRKRNIINISGVYFQSIFLLLFALVALIFNLKVPFFICFLGNIGILVNLFPFIKLDGYWILNDCLDTDNLMSKAIDNILKFLGIKKGAAAYISDSPLKEKIFKVYSFCLVFFFILYGIVFVKMFYDNVVVLYGIFMKADYAINIVWMSIRSIFIIFTSLKVTLVIVNMLKGRRKC